MHSCSTHASSLAPTHDALQPVCGPGALVPAPATAARPPAQQCKQHWPLETPPPHSSHRQSIRRPVASRLDSRTLPGSAVPLERCISTTQDVWSIASSASASRFSRSDPERGVVPADEASCDFQRSGRAAAAPSGAQPAVLCGRVFRCIRGCTQLHTALPHTRRESEGAAECVAGWAALLKRWRVVRTSHGGANGLLDSPV